MSDPSRFPVRDATVTARMVGDEVVLVLPEHGQAKVLNEVGARVWALADGTRSLDAIIDALCAEYEVDRAHAAADTLAFVAELESRGLISLAADPQPAAAPPGA